MTTKKLDVQNRHSLDNYHLYNEEEKRLKTFSNWPAHYPVCPSRLAKSGFYYSGNEDEVTCFSCEGRISHWQFGDIVQKRHKELYPHCNFVNNRSNNVALVSKQYTFKSKLPSETHANNNSSSNTSVANKDSYHLSNFPVNISSKQALNDCNIKLDSQIMKLDKSKNDIEVQKMTSLEERLRTFGTGWPLMSPSTQDLAMAGFFFLGQEDKVQCAFCKGIVKNWDVKDVPLLEHLHHFPECKYIQSLMNQRSRNTIPCAQECQDVCGSSNVVSQFELLPSTCKLIDNSQHHTKANQCGAQLCISPAHPDKSTFAARLMTFLAWPRSAPVEKEALAAAGFFYIGISDYTKCFCCDGGLQSWEPDDDPWVEHARWYSNCNFLHLNKDEDFIKQCAKMKSDEDFSWEKRQLQISNTNIACSNNALTCKVEEAMKSSLIAAIIKIGIYPPYLIRAAVFQQLKDNGIPFTSVEEVCQSINFLKAKIKAISVAKKEERAEKMSFSMHTNEKSCLKSVSNGKTHKSVGETENPVSANSVSGADSKLEENQFLIDQRLCKICMDNDVSIVFLPCGHLLACIQCAPALNYCPMCRQPIQKTVRAFLS